MKFRRSITIFALLTFVLVTSLVIVLVQDTVLPGIRIASKSSGTYGIGYSLVIEVNGVEVYSRSATGFGVAETISVTPGSVVHEAVPLNIYYELLGGSAWRAQVQYGNGYCLSIEVNGVEVFSQACTGFGIAQAITFAEPLLPLSVLVSNVPTTTTTATTSATTTSRFTFSWSVSFSFPTISVPEPTFTIETPELHTWRSIFMLGLFLGLYIIYSRIFGTFHALATSGAVSFIISFIFFGFDYTSAMLLTLTLAAIAAWKLLGR